MKIYQAMNYIFQIEDVKIEHIRAYIWSARLLNKQIASFNYVRIKDKVWFEYGTVDEKYQQNGVGSLLIQAAVKQYGQVYFCEVNRQALIELTGSTEYQQRYLTSEGRSLAESCIRKGIIKKEWLTVPDKEE